MGLRLLIVIATLAVILPFAKSSTNDHATFLSKALRERNLSTPGRELKAATKATHLTKRFTEFMTVNKIDLTYSEVDNSNGGPNFGASVHATSDVPILLLEDFEHLADYIVCQPEYITIRALPGLDGVAASTALLGLVEGGLVITSHHGCNSRGERRLFRVGVVNVSEDGSVFVLSTTQASWETSFTALNIKMYHTTEGHALRPHEELHRRQDSPTTTADNQPTNSIPEPTATSTSEVNTLDLNHSLIDHDFLPSNSSLQITCKNCSTFGTIDFSFVQFELKPDLEKILEPPLELSDVFQGGEVTVVAHNLGARVEILTNITKGEEKQFPLFTVPLVFGVTVSGIGAAGLLYAPRLDLKYNINGSIAFTSGFEIDVPDNSKLIVDMTDPGNSSVTGFQDTTVNSIPFNASVDVTQALFDVSLRHEIEIAFFLGIAGASAGVYLDLPRFEAELTHLTAVDENCTALATSKSQNKDVAQKVLTDVYKMTPAVDWQVGVAGEVHVSFIKDSFDVPFDNGTIADVAASCLNFDPKTGTYMDAAAVVKKAKNGAGRLGVASATCWAACLATLAMVLL